MTSSKFPPFNGRRLPPVPKLASLGVFGATAAFTALSIGSGELMFWPALVVSAGAGVIWIAIAIVAMQWLVNTEVARFSLATGQTVGAALSRRAPILGFLLLLGAIVPWIWPGWIRAGGQMLSTFIGVGEKPISLVLLLLCAASLLVPHSVYNFLVRIQSFMLAAILLGIVWLFCVVALNSGGLTAFFREFMMFDGAGSMLADVAILDDAAYYGLLSGLVFAGAGGILNLGYGYLVLARNAEIKSEIISNASREADDTHTVWKRWIAVLRREHAILFVGGNVVSIVFLSSIFFMIYSQSGTEVSGITLLDQTFHEIGGAYGYFNAGIFALVGFLVFFTSSIGILDLTCRIGSDIFSALFGKSFVLGRPIYAALIVLQTIMASILIFLDPRQPFWLITTAAVLNTLVMVLYTFAIVWLNRTTLDKAARASVVVEICVLGLGVIYLLVFLMTAIRMISI